MKKRFKNILAKKRKKNGVAVLICAILSAYTENAVGSYDVNTGILSFSGTDISTESIISAYVAIQGDNLLVTLTHSEYLTGETFEFEPGQP